MTADVSEDSSRPPLTSPASRRALARQLLAWFAKSARDLPWRGTSDLYAIWVSEIMLQQTQVATVIPYFQRFLRAFPTVADLAAASEEQVLKHWEGLGYYRRARQLHAAARKIVAEHRGQFPTTYDAVRSLPGIGRYTAGAILSIGLGQRLPILEANTIRVLSRLSAYRGDPTATAGQKHLWSLAEELLPAREVGAFNQALMELGSEICTPKAPACEQCPVLAQCGAFALGLQASIPLAAKKTKYEEVTEIAVVVRNRDKVLLRKCQPGERWAGLWDFPRFAAGGGTVADEIASKVAELTGVRVAAGPQLATLKHGVTRFRITLHCYESRCLPQAKRATTASAATTAEIVWAAPKLLKQLPLSSTGRKIAGLLQSR
ncbi:MAG: A/G-specific adenine glycosylase [Pirellulaceae bacterium]|nr:A/G-specific adenine glycosylase [Pirellulaceae bacterium]